MQKFILRNFQSPGDITMLTAAVRDLHLCYGDQYQTDVRTSCSQLWENNPYLTPLDEHVDDVKVVDCHYPLIHRSNQAPYHFIHGFIEFLNHELNLDIRPTAFKGDIHISAAERILVPQVTELTGERIPYWIISSGGKRDYTIKWWDHQRYQKVVDHFRGVIQFVQVGASGHFHPELEGTIDLRGKTNLRQLVRLMYHARGVVTPVSLLMHLSAAVEMGCEDGLHSKDGLTRPCIVIAGGREPTHWEAYPTHQFLHTVGMLPCCATGGCWRARTKPIGDGDEKDQPKNLCVDVVGKLPRCMDIIKAEHVIERIEAYLAASKVPTSPLLESQRADSHNGNGIAVLQTATAAVSEDKLDEQSALTRSELFIRSIPEYPGGFKGKGIVICGGGLRYFACAWVCISMLRRLGCTLPVQLWHLGRKEMDQRMKALITPFRVECIDALEVRKKHPARILNGWELKAYSILHSPFKEVLLLDADNVAIVDPTFLFKTSQYRESGAVFWPDFNRLRENRSVWRICGISYQDEPEFESGQILVNKEKCWKALSLAMWYNEYSDFFYQHIHGDKETFHMAFRKLGQPFAMPATPVLGLSGTMCQHDFEGRRIFQHRNLDKWNLFGTNRRISGFILENECFSDLEQLRRRWHEKPEKIIYRFEPREKSTDELAVAETIMNHVHEYARVGWDSRKMAFLPDGTVGLGAGGCEVFWDVENGDDGLQLIIGSEKGITCRLKRTEADAWQGNWLIHQQMPVTLSKTKDRFPKKVEVPAKARRFRPDSKRVVFRGPINAYTGYGLHACQIVTDLARIGYGVKIRPTEIAEEFAPIPARIKKHFVQGIQQDDWELLLNPPNIPTTPGKRTVYFTMWEASRLPKEWVEWLNQAECVVVPCQWNATSFSASGVNRPIHVVPLGIKSEIFDFSPLNMKGPCVFGAAGKVRGGGERKGLQEVVEVFQQAFPNQPDVRLRIKAFEDCGLEVPNDPRIEIMASYLKETQMADWYRSLTCFISLSRSEGWGLMPHQAMAIGRPCIATKFGGHAEFFNETVGYCANYRLAPARYNYSGGGVWAEPDVDHVVDLMRRVYRNRKEARTLGRNASTHVAGFTWRQSNRKLLEILRTVGMLK